VGRTEGVWGTFLENSRSDLLPPEEKLISTSGGPKRALCFSKEKGREPRKEKERPPAGRQLLYPRQQGYIPVQNFPLNRVRVFLSYGEKKRTGKKKNIYRQAEPP